MSEKSIHNLLRTSTEGDGKRKAKSSDGIECVKLDAVAGSSHDIAGIEFDTLMNILLSRRDHMELTWNHDRDCDTESSFLFQSQWNEKVCA